MDVHGLIYSVFEIEKKMNSEESSAPLIRPPLSFQISDEWRKYICTTKLSPSREAIPLIRPPLSSFQISDEQR
jgi:hypothetical protein